MENDVSPENFGNHWLVISGEKDKSGGKPFEITREEMKAFYEDPFGEQGLKLLNMWRSRIMQSSETEEDKAEVLLLLDSWQQQPLN